MRKLLTPLVAIFFLFAASPASSASYAELFDLQRNQILLDKITVAVIISTNTIFSNADTGAPWDGANHANRLIWAREAAKNPRRMAEVFMANVLAENQAATATAIINATDAAIQVNVNATVDKFANGTAVLQ